MSLSSPDPPGGPRMSRGIKLVLMGVAGAALLYSCAPGIAGGLGGLPYLWFLPNPFYRGPAVTTSTTPGSTVSRPDASKTTPAPTQSQRGGFGSTGSAGGSSGSS